MNNDSQPEMKYWAFISYSHRDKKWGTWLHRKLETYRIPKYLSKNDQQTLIPKRIFPVFRDREELPTSADLGNSVQKALEASRTLIVICSPNSATSRWVNEEILSFKAMGKSNRIFCLIVDGEPNASDHSDTEDNECFAPALRYKVDASGTLTSERAEPIAADARPGKDGKQDGVVKLLAGVIGVGYDELKRRDLQRKIRRLVSFSIAASLLLALTVSLTFFALYSRAEALRQRQIAQEQFERAEENFQKARATVDRFFVNVSEEDLFETHGLQPLQEKLLNDALEYYRDFLDQHSDNPSLLLETASTSQKVGDITALIGDRQKALEHYQDSLAQLETLADQQGKTTEIQNQLAECLEGMAVVHWELEQPKMALEILVRAQTVLQDIRHKEPSNQRATDTWKSVVRNLGPFQRHSGMPDEARETYQKAWDEWLTNEGSKPRHIGAEFSLSDSEEEPVSLHVQQVTPSSAAHAAGIMPGDLIESVNGTAVKTTTDLKNAITALSSGDTVELTIKRDNTTETTVLTLQGQVDIFAAIIAMNTGVLIQTDFHDAESALEWYERAREVGENLLLYAQAEGISAESTELNITRHLLSSIHIYLANLDFSNQEYEKAIEHQARSYELIGFLADNNPTVSTYQESLAVTASNLAATRDHVEPGSDTFDLHQRAAQAMRRLRTSHPDNIGYSFQLAQISNNLAIYHVNRELFSDAERYYVEAETLLEEMLDQNQNAMVATQLGDARRNLGSVLITLNRLEDAERAYTKSANVFLDLIKQAEPAQRPAHWEILSTVYLKLASVAELKDDNDALQHYLELAVDIQDNHVTYLEELLVQNPDDPSIRQSLAVALNNHGSNLMDADVPKSREYFRRILELYRSVPTQDELSPYDMALVARGHGNLGWIDLLSKNFTESISHSLAALQYDSQQDWIHLNLASAYVCNSQYDEARVIYTRLQKASQDPRAFRSTIEEEFINLESSGITHPDMERILKELDP